MKTEPPPPPTSQAQYQDLHQGQPPSQAVRPRLWNPNAAGLLSVLLTPLFGPVIHGLNWRALGHDRDARISFIWAGVLLLATLIIMVVFDEPPFLLYLALILLWHIRHGRKQIALAKSLPGGYQKKNLWIPAGVALGAMVALIVPFTVIGAIFDSGAYDVTHDEGYETIILGKFEDGKNRDDYAEVSVEDLKENSEKYQSKSIRIELEVGAGDPWIEERTGRASKIIQFRASDEGAFGIGDMVISSFLIPDVPDHTLFNDIAKINLRPGERIIVSGSLSSMRELKSNYRKVAASEGIDIRELDPEGGLHDFQIFAEQIVVYRREDQKQITTNPDGFPSDQKQITINPDGSPSDQTVRNAAESLNTEFADQPFKRGDILESMGGGGIPIGTQIYPIKLEGFYHPIYMSRDEFGDWRFSFEGAPRLIEVPTTEEIKARREAERERAMKDERERQDFRVEQAERAHLDKKAEDEKRAKDEEQLKRNNEERANARIEEERARLEHIRRTEDIRDETMESLRVAGERQRLENDLRDEAIKAGKGTAIVPTKKEIPAETEDAPTPDKPIGLAEAKAELAALNSQITSEQKRWADATFIVNKLTNFRKSPVEKNSPAHHQSYAALKIIQEVEQKAPAMKADKVRLEKLIEELSPKK